MRLSDWFPFMTAKRRAECQSLARRDRSHVPTSQRIRFVRVGACVRDVRVRAHVGAHVADARTRTHNRIHWDIWVLGRKKVLFGGGSGEH